MTRECQVRICERLGVKFPGPTRQQRVGEAVKKVLVDEVAPHAQRIWAEWRRISCAARELDQAVQWLHLGIIGPSELPQLAINATDGAQPWQEAEVALRTDPDAKLPNIPGAMGPMRR
jgi:hypothetical protein